MNPPDHRHQQVVFLDMVDVEVQGGPWFVYLWSQASGGSKSYWLVGSHIGKPLGSMPPSIISRFLQSYESTVFGACARVGKLDHRMWNVAKDGDTRLKRDLQGWTERTLAVRTLSDACFVDIRTCMWAKLWPHKWCVSGGISNSLRPCKMKVLFSTAHMPSFVCCFGHPSPWSPMTSTSCLFWHGRRRDTGFVTFQGKAGHWETFQLETWLVRWLLLPSTPCNPRC